MPRHVSRITSKGYHRGRQSPTKGTRLYAETYTRQEVFMLVDANNCGPGGLRYRALIVLLYRTGLRISEALNLRPHDIDFERKTIRVRGTKTRTSDRVVPLDKVCEAHLRDWMDVRKDELKLPPTGYVFCCISRHERGNRMGSSQFRVKLQQLANQAGVNKRVHPHGFRHTFASELATERIDIRYISRALGHANSAITARYIDHINPAEMLQIVGSRT